MVNDRSSPSRRVVLQRSSLALAGLFGLSGGASAKPDSRSSRAQGQDGSFAIELEDGQLKLEEGNRRPETLKRVESARRQKRDDVQRVNDGERLYKSMIQQLNRSAKSGEIEFEERDGTVHVVIESSGGEI